MNSPARRQVGFLCISLLWLTAAVANSSHSFRGGPEPTAEQKEFFEAKIRPVLAKNCFGCHGKDQQKSGLRLDSLASIKKGGDSGPALVAGDPAKSLLIVAVKQTTELKMPPTGAKLSTSEIVDLESWVKSGAPWPADATSANTLASPLWSLQAVQKPSLPAVRLKSWVRNPVDSFILAKLEANHLHPSAAADRRTLLRRVTYDLTGLPPTPEETDAFLSDKASNAYEKVVDRLLNSPHYGERAARHWMDVARYADTKGYVFNEDRNYANAYTYRDWLINSFNHDLPYDQFIVDQLAADRLPAVQSKSDRTPLAAMGFLTLGRRFINNPLDIIDDRIDVTMRGLQGFTVGCARCHDHKFDPIPTQDYYSLYAVFASSTEQTLPISPSSVSDPWEEFSQRKRNLETSIQNLILDQIKVLRSRSTNGPAIKQELQSLGIGAPPSDHTLNILLPAFEPAEVTRLEHLKSDLADLNRKAPPTPEFATTMVDGPNPTDGVVFHHGNPGNPGIAAPRRFLLALSKPGTEREHWTQGSGRLELARAIASRENPLTARVFVNRVWQDHFGSGIVRTPSDFGHQGEKPTDPKLLDYLAYEFMDKGWSIKKLHRMIVTSATYCQASSVTSEMYNADPDNRLWGRMNRRRLDLEQMRDTLMMDSGRLQGNTIGGKSVDLWSEPFAPRRAVYGFIERQNLPGVFRTFDFASPDSTSAKRFQTTVPQQALFFMNSTFAIDQARLIVERPEIVQAKDDGQRIRRLYRILFDRLPDSEELATGEEFFKGQPALVAGPTSSWEYGYGEFDPTQNRTVKFTPLSFYKAGQYQVGEKFPDPDLGYITLSSSGGHPGRDKSHEVIRRWVATSNGTVSIEGQLTHGQSLGDGIRGRIVSSRTGLLGEWLAHNSQAMTKLTAVEVRAGDYLDFVVDCVGNDAYDGFSWSPTVRSIDRAQFWSASALFSPPPPAPINRWTLYAQALLMTNEFMFVD